MVSGTGEAVSPERCVIAGPVSKDVSVGGSKARVVEGVSTAMSAGVDEIGSALVF